MYTSENKLNLDENEVDSEMKSLNIWDTEGSTPKVELLISTSVLRGRGGAGFHYISKNYYMRPERPMHQTLRTLRTLTITLDTTSARRHVRTPFPIYPCVHDVPTTSSTKRMHPNALRP